MLPEQHQRILGYFIEESKEHLGTIERGLLNLPNTLTDSEQVNEIFRAAHSIKGGAAMLGLGSIQKTAHRLEDCFKVFKEGPVKVDQKLETLFLRVFDTLQEQLEQLSGPAGLPEEVASNIIAAAEPVFEELSTHLNSLASQSAPARAPAPAPARAPAPAKARAKAPAKAAGKAPAKGRKPAAKSSPEKQSARKATGAASKSKNPDPSTASQEKSALQLIFQSDVPARLREMLQLFKQPEQPLSRQELQEICRSLLTAGHAFDLQAWCGLLQTATAAIGNPDIAYRALAPTVIKDIKQAQELVLAGRWAEIRASDALKSQARRSDSAGKNSPPPPPKEKTVPPRASALPRAEPKTAHSAGEKPMAATAPPAGTPAKDSAPDVREKPLSTRSGDPPAPRKVAHTGPEVGMAELNSLADLFEGETPDLDTTWEAEEVIDSYSMEPGGADLIPDVPAGTALAETADTDFSDLLFDEKTSGTTADFAPEIDDINSLFGDALLDEESSEEPQRPAAREAGELWGAEPGDTFEQFETADSFDLVLAQQSKTSKGSLADAGNLDELFDGLEESGFLGEDLPVLPELSPVSQDDLADIFEDTPELATQFEDKFENKKGTGETSAESPGQPAALPREWEELWQTSEETPDLLAEIEAPELDGAISDWLGEMETSSNRNSQDLSDLEFSSLFEGEAVADGVAFPFRAQDSPETSISQIRTHELTAAAAEEEDASLDFEDLFDLEAPASESLTENIFRDMGGSAPSKVRGQQEEGEDFSDSLELLFETSLEEEPEAPGTPVTESLDFDETDLFGPETAAGTGYELGDDWPSDGLLATAAEETLDLSENLEAFFATELDADRGSQEISDSWSYEEDSTLELEFPDFASDGSSAEAEAGLEVSGGAADESADDLAFFNSFLEAAEQEIEESSEQSAILNLTSQEDLPLLVPDGFADLEALLEEEPTALNSGPFIEADSDVFSELEDLIGETPPQGLPVAQRAPAKAAAPIAPQPLGEEDGFSDLVDMLPSDMQTGAGKRPGPGSQVKRQLIDQSMRVPIKQLDNLSNLVGELVVNRNSLEQNQERLRQFLDNLLHQVQQLSDVGQRMQDLYERSLLEISLLASRQSYSAMSGGRSRDSHSTGASFDALEMDRFTGFHTQSQEIIELIVRVRESASDIEFLVDETEQVTRQLRQITTQLQEGLTRSRMVPFAQTADRLPRSVRDVAIKEGKLAELVIEGRETLIDKMIADQLFTPLNHLVNNAIAHGIEPPEVRKAANPKKPETGRLTIRAFHQGNQTVISFSDDGAGINLEKVKYKAIEKKLITQQQAKNLTRQEVYELLFLPGFSTKDQVDDIAGRGVGLNVVQEDVHEIRGTIGIDSTLGQGTTFTIRLPLTLSISKALVCISDRARIAFPMDGVEDMLDVPKDRVQMGADGQQCIPWRDSMLGFRHLRELLGYNRHLGRGNVYGANPEDDVISVVVLRSAGNYLALQVDQVLGEQEIVIKQLEGPVPKPAGIAGATVMGDGRIVAIADVLELLDLAAGRLNREKGTWIGPDSIEPVELVEKNEPTVLIVDDSITVRELLSMTFNKAGYRVEQARDGQEAWEKLRSGLPCDIVFCDIEMPRMDGLELLSRMQKDPILTDMPIAMLTSRGADRHRQMAIQLGARGYFTKPYLEEALLEAASRMLKGEVLVTAKAEAQG
ncbi:response regulator [Kamptonema formosum]|uniref:response regulator n=1 Tax=Kamptonema formosum TaxID=331992 RepID=UPI000344C588|nr:response regulator [Oscillatoria sp. PCC 10802]